MTFKRSAVVSFCLSRANFCNRFVNSLLDERNVGLAPGYTFGPGNEEHVRLCYAQSHERLRSALRTMVEFIRARGSDFGIRVAAATVARTTACIANVMVHRRWQQRTEFEGCERMQTGFL